MILQASYVVNWGRQEKVHLLSYNTLSVDELGGLHHFEPISRKRRLRRRLSAHHRACPVALWAGGKPKEAPN